MFISGYITKKDFKAIVIEKKKAFEFTKGTSQGSGYIFPVQFQRTEIEIIEAYEHPPYPPSNEGLMRESISVPRISCSLVDSNVTI